MAKAFPYSRLRDHASYLVRYANEFFSLVCLERQILGRRLHAIISVALLSSGFVEHLADYAFDEIRLALAVLVDIVAASVRQVSLNFAVAFAELWIRPKSVPKDDRSDPSL